MPPPTEVVRSLQDLRGLVARRRGLGDRVALIPTMGAIHDGHLSLVRFGLRRCEQVIASIFVNPRQFGPNEDFARYPRDEAADVAKFSAAGCDAVWVPSVDDMYPPGFATRVEVAGAAEALESDFRPHHFGGVATVCLKLFSAVSPDVAVFGEKDYQQLCVIRQMVRDFNLPLEIVGVPTVREADGLALSSRNAYLSAEERRVAPLLNEAIRRVANVVRDGGDHEAAAQETTVALLAAGFAKVDYVAVRDAETLAPLSPSPATKPARVLAAAWLGKTRLIDNVAVDE